MTGIERLREFVAGIGPFTIACSVTTTSYDRKHMEVAGARLRDYLTDIADQIEREQTDELLWRLIVVQNVVDRMRSVCSDPCSSCSVTSGFVLSWARDLEEALGCRDRADDVSMSAHDLLPEEEREAVAWVREHGGRDEVEADCAIGEGFSDLADEVAQRLGLCIDGLDAQDSRPLLMDALDRRLMPEGMEWLVEAWPRFEDGEPVRIGDVVSDVEVRSVLFRDDGILLSDCTSVPGWGTWRSYKEPIKRPAPKVLDADGVEIYKGRIAYGTRGRKYRVTELCEYEPSIVHAQAIDDGELGDEFIAANTGLNSYQLDASKLTHERPIADTWERLEEDAEKDPCSYFGFDGEETCGKCPASEENCEQTMARDLVRRAKKLAERDAK